MQVESPDVASIINTVVMLLYRDDHVIETLFSALSINAANSIL